MLPWRKQHPPEEPRRPRNRVLLNFTEDCRHVLNWAREEAIMLQHDYVGTEHILLGLIRLPDSLPRTILEREGIDTDAVRAAMDQCIRHGKATIALGELPYTSRAKQVLNFAIEAAADLGIQYVAPEQILLGLLMEEKGIAAQVLVSLGLNRGRAAFLVRAAYAEKLPGASPATFKFKIDDASDRSIFEQIIGQVQEGIATGALKPGDRLQAVRQLADELEIAPGTVARAYGELERLGVVVTGGARGTRIAEPSRTAGGPAGSAETLAGLLRPVAVAAFHLGANADELRTALEQAMTGIFEKPPNPDQQASGER